MKVERNLNQKPFVTSGRSEGGQSPAKARPQRRSSESNPPADQVKLSAEAKQLKGAESLPTKAELQAFREEIKANVKNGHYQAASLSPQEQALKEKEEHELSIAKEYFSR